MEMTSPPGKLYLTTAVYYFVFIALGMATAVLGPTLQDLAKNTNATLAQISSLFLLSSFGYLVGSFGSGNLYDRVKGHPILAAGVLILAGMLGIVPFIGTLLMLQVVFFIIGIAESSLDVGINTLIVWLHGDRVPPFMNGLHAFYGIGTTAAPLIVAAVLSSGRALGSVYWIIAILILPIGLLTVLFSSPSHVLANQQAIARPAIPILVFLTTLIFFAFTGAELGFGGWIYTFTTSQLYGTPTLAAAINAAFWAAITVGRLISIPISIRLKPRIMLWINFCGIVVSLLVIIFFSSNQVLLWLGTLGTGLFMASTFPGLLNDAQSRMHLSGKVTSIFFAGASLGSMILPWIMGQVIAPFGATSVMVVDLCCILISAVTFFILNANQHRIALPPAEISASGKLGG
jgi:FHS family Na+ dependent glucose MFS transporter 1